MLVSFVLGMMATALAEDELLLEARLPLLAPDTRFGFYEFSRRAGDYALAMALVTFRLQVARRRAADRDRRRRGAASDSPGWMGLRPGGIGFLVGCSRSRSGMTIGALRLLSGDLCQEAAELQ